MTVNNCKTNRDVINHMTNEELAYWAINIAPKIGKRYTSSVGGLEIWLGEQEESISEITYRLAGVKIKHWTK